MHRHTAWIEWVEKSFSVHSIMSVDDGFTCTKGKKKQSTHFQWHVCYKLHDTRDDNIIALSLSSIVCDSNNILFKSHEIRTTICNRDILLCAKLKSPHAMTLWNFPFDRFQRIRYTKIFWIHETVSEEVRVRKTVECIGLCIVNNGINLDWFTIRGSAHISRIQWPKLNTCWIRSPKLTIKKRKKSVEYNNIQHSVNS